MKRERNPGSSVGSRIALRSIRATNFLILQERALARVSKDEAEVPAPSFETAAVRPPQDEGGRSSAASSPHHQSDFAGTRLSTAGSRISLRSSVLRTAPRSTPMRRSPVALARLCTNDLSSSKRPAAGDQHVG